MAPVRPQDAAVGIEQNGEMKGSPLEIIVSAEAPEGLEPGIGEDQEREFLILVGTVFPELQAVLEDLDVRWDAALTRRVLALRLISSLSMGALALALPSFGPDRFWIALILMVGVPARRPDRELGPRQVERRSEEVAARLDCDRADIAGLVGRLRSELVEGGIDGWGLVHRGDGHSMLRVAGNTRLELPF